MMPVLVEVKFCYSYLSSLMLYMTSLWSSSLQVAARSFCEVEKHTLATELVSSFDIMRDEWSFSPFFLASVSHRMIMGFEPTSPVATVLPAISRQLISSLC